MRRIAERELLTQFFDSPIYVRKVMADGEADGQMIETEFHTDDLKTDFTDQV